MNIKTLVSLPSWAEAFNEGKSSSNSIADAKAAYARVPLIFRAARIRANSLRKLPLHFRQIGAEEDSDNPFDIDFGDLVWRTEMALLFRGGAVWLKNKKQMPEMGLEINQGLAWLNPFTVNIEWKSGERLFWQQVGNDRYPKSGFWTDADIVFIREFSFDDDVSWGTAAADVALGDAQLSYYLRRVASVFFENGAMPVTLAQIVGLSSNPEDANNRRVSDFLRRSIAGIGKFARILAIGNEVKMTTTQSPLKDMIMPELSADTRKHIALAFEIPVTLLDDDANYATAHEHKRGFYDETIIPRSDVIGEQLNKQWLAPLGYELEFSPQELDLYQEDESKRASSLGQLVSAINTDIEVAKLAMGILGYDLSEEQEDELDALIASKEANRVAMAQVKPAESVPPQFGGQNAQDEQGTGGDQAAKSIERGQYERFAAKHPDKIGSFKFLHLDESEQAALKGAQSSETDANPFPSIASDSTRSAYKSITEVTQRFEHQLTALVLDAWANRQGVIKTEMRLLVQRYAEDAFFQGLIDGGASPDNLSERDREWIDEQTANQVAYVAKFSADVKDALSDPAAQGQIITRIGLWAQDIAKAGNLGRVAASRTRKAKLQWHTARDEVTCKICVPLNNRVVEAGEPFGEDADGAPIYSPPGHKHCRCSTTEYIED